MSTASTGLPPALSAARGRERPAEVSPTNATVRPTRHVLRRKTLAAVATTGALVIAAVHLLNGPLWQTYVVRGASMEPTLRCGGSPGCSKLRSQHVFVSAVPYALGSPRRGDIVLVELPRPSCDGERQFLKRIVGLPSETIAETGGVVRVDGRPLHEAYVPSREHGHGSFGPIKLGLDQYFVMGDNRALSCDSRTFGPIRRSSIRGEVLNPASLLSS